MEPTRRLYDTDADLKSCDTRLVAVERTPAGTLRAALADTVFYPEGGGQPADRGALTFAAGGEARVLDVQREGDVVWHTLDALPETAAVGAAVRCRIDWARRFDHMQQHTGEHILSGMLHRLYGAENVGFHIGTAQVRMDTSIPLTPAQLRNAETAANRVVWADAPVEVLYPEPAALAAMAYRSKKALAGQVRIVRIADADVCACCGTHTATAGQVGLIKILTAERYKGGMRLGVVCGARALAEMQATAARQRQIGALLSAERADTADAVARLHKAHADLQYAHRGLADRLNEALAAQCVPGVPAVEVLPGLAPDELHRLAAALAGAAGTVCAALSPNEKGVGYALAWPGGDVRALTGALNGAFAGRGGGKPGLCQGSCTAGTAEKIRDFLLEKCRALAGEKK